ncbi:MAG: hypothetical protein EA383_15770, partial [Spirochaetaceae bacterium]
MRLPFWSRIRKTRQGKLAGDEPIGVGENPLLREQTTGASEETQWRLIWRRFRRHHLAMGGLVVVIMLY